MYVYIVGAHVTDYIPVTGSNQLDESGAFDQESLLQPRFPCTVCGRRFQFRCHLEVHMRIHLGLKPFQCSQCGSAFTQRNNLNVHMKRHLKQ